MKILMMLLFSISVLSVSAQVRVSKNIAYTDAMNDSRRQLNIYHQDLSKSVTSIDGRDQADVLIFIHGGSWSSGKKETYWWLGRNLAKKGVVTVIINYGLAPEQQYKQMAADCAAAVKWVSANIAKYGGNPDRIFLMGHSAGAHLAELINADPQYLKAVGFHGDIKGVVLNDAFGLDMGEYMSHAEQDDNYYNFLRTFSNDPATWILGSPLHYIENVKNPHLIFYGDRTYPAIQIQSKRMANLLKTNDVPVTLREIKRKKHVGMISQMVFSRNQLYGEIIDFLKNNG
ncbi:esterase/lipase/thioesterase family protein [Pedobacter sp. BAL39]|uniref:alpha/beta hydrolase n=1 Tax=Pedobacter sp. BAL39 TaxID=391596 RepID=UPI0001559524|nr:alpha/beta hydrolase [Pedobacter sp. BAL39]EDM36157.1 esterase/lipase/thioesterase family protein [Pedobacter sp. BAL39]